MPEKDTKIGGKSLDPSQRADLVAKLQKGRATARAKALLPDSVMAKAKRIEQDKYLEETDWVEMAKSLGLRLPGYGKNVTTGAMTRWIKALGSTVPKYLEWAQEKSLVSFAKNNPSWPLRSWAGLVLEAHLEGGKL